MGIGSSHNEPSGGSQWPFQEQNPTWQISLSSGALCTRRQTLPPRLPASKREREEACVKWHQSAHVQINIQVNYKTGVCTYFVQLVKIQNLSFHMRNFQSASLELPEFSYLIQEVELNSGLSLKTGWNKKGSWLFHQHFIVKAVWRTRISQIIWHMKSKIWRTSSSLSLCIRGVNFSLSTSHANGGCHSWRNTHTHIY